MKNLLEQFLDELEVAYTRRYADELYNSHPHKHNMYGLKMMLETYGIRCIGVKITDNDLSALTYPCILHTHGDFVIATEYTDTHIIYRHQGVETTVSHSDARRIWTGNALVVDGESDASEPDYTGHRHKEILETAKRYLLPVLMVVAVIGGIAGNLQKIDHYVMASLILNSVGLTLCLLLMQKQIFGASRYGDKVCSLFSHSDCNSILDGKASGVMGMKWSEIGFGYFAANILVCSLYPGAVGVAAVINWIAMLYGVWSVYYQWRIAQNWCALCIAVQVIVWADGIIYAAQIETITFGIADILCAGVIFGSCIAAVNLYATVYSAEDERLRLLQQYRALKAKSIVADAMIKEQEYHETTLGDSSIVFGSPDARLRITIMSNPHCNPCALMHRKVESLLAMNHRNICVQYIFSSFSRQLEDSSRYLILCYLKNEEKEARRLFDRWYASDAHERTGLVKEVSDCLHSEEVEAEMERHMRWREMTRLPFTPTVLVNGYILPKEYDIMDLAMIVDL